MPEKERVIEEPDEQKETPSRTKNGRKPSYVCPSCGRAFTTSQGLAGHRRLAHFGGPFAALSREVPEENNEEAEEEGSPEVSDAEKIRQSVRKVVAEKVASLPSATTETILRVNGDDYQIDEDGNLSHLYWPSGEKTPVDEGAWFEFQGRAYCIKNGRLREVKPSEVLLGVLDEKESPEEATEGPAK